ncbi:MAG: phosphate ABC transporter permease subunit PstC [Candidatus Methanomethylophilaceae archaeon]|nr:phosphate ABC transporter permease subunit PstC [Candidatus Methanomethylophilaceae archaeon]
MSADTINLSNDPTQMNVNNMPGDPKRSLFQKIRKTDKAKLILAGIVVMTVSVLFFILIFITYNSLDAVREVGLWDFITGASWIPGSGVYGASSLIVGTLLVTIGAVLIAVPVGIGVAIYLSDIASARARNIVKPVCELFAGIPSVVYGFLGIVILIPLLLDIFPDQLSYGYSWLAGSLVLAMMATPTIISVSEDALSAVPKSYYEASIAMGATKWETIRKVSLRAASSGLGAAITLGIGRAIGETMVVLMVCGNTAIIPEPLWNIFSTIRTISATIAGEFPETSWMGGDVHFSALFLLGLILLMMVLAVNLFTRHIIKRTKRKMGEGIKKKGAFAKRIEKSTEGISLRLERYIPFVKRTVFAAVIFAFGFMISDLFLGMVGGILFGILCVIVYVASIYLAKYLGPKLVQVFVYSSFRAIAYAMIVILVIIIGVLVYKGASALNWNFITDVPSSMGKTGGIGPAILGTLELMVLTAVVAFPIGVCCGIYFSQYSGKNRFVSVARESIDILNGMPSIVFGLFGMTVMVAMLGWGMCLLAGCITLALMIIPTIIKTTEESLNAVPHELTEASMALGASKWKTIVRVVIPAGMGGMITGMILGLGRAVGETAPIMLTAAVLLKRTYEFSLFDPVMSLPYHLYMLVKEIPNSTANQYGTALVLMILIIIMFASASLIRHHYRKKLGW